ncbi:CHASE domain-containing protein [Hahella sp. KA22]|uniref:CHASE domain-containing protein n=1 Tax=Hahella sp. KA22 TaxID=1628392 RepID=UPI0013E405BA|nr:CHASE domain-containing protein [Hahella sp. KA22]
MAKHQWPSKLGVLAPACALAIAYFLTARAGLLLSLSGSNASPVWIPAGIALAGMVHYGRSIWPAIWLASFAVELVSQQADSFSKAILALAISIGAPLEAVIGTTLIRMHADFSPSLEKKEDVARLLILGGPVACVISATLSIGLMSSLGVIHVQDAGAHWLAWWFGDTFGVLIFAPILLLWLQKENSTLKRRLLVTLPGLASFILAVISHYYLVQADQKQIKEDVRQQGVQLRWSTFNQVQGITNAVSALALLFEGSKVITPKDFERYASQFRNFHRDISGLGWAPYVDKASRSNFEHWASLLLEKDYQIRETLGQLQIPASERDFYVPVLYVTPNTDVTRAAQGFDLYSNDIRRSAILESMRKGDLTLTAPITLVGNYGKGAICIAPVYSSPPQSANSDQARQIMGFVVGSVQIGNLIDRLSQDINLELFHIEIFDITEPEQPEALFISRQSAPDNPLQDMFTQTMQMDISGRVWRISITPTHLFIKQDASITPWIALILAVLFGSLLTAVLLLETAHTVKIEKAVIDQSQRLVKAETRYQELFTGLKQVIFQADKSYQWRVLNPAWNGLTGENPEDAVGREMFHYFHPDDCDKLRDALQKIARLEESSLFLELRLNALQLERAPWVEVHLQRSKDASGKLDGYSGFIADISERKRLDILKTEFISTVSHELRTPLTAINGSLALLDSGRLGLLPDQARQMLHIAYSNCERLLRLINDLLDIQKIESGGLEFSFERLDLRDLIGEALSANQQLAEKASVTLAFEPPASPALVKADRDRLRQVLDNLISNAIKFSPADKTVSLTLNAHAHYWEVSVQDQGPGVPPEFRNKIFQKFAQADSSDTRLKGGTGLGLSISREIVQRHHGQIGYHSEPNCGATFYFRLHALTNGAVWEAQASS